MVHFVIPYGILLVGSSAVSGDSGGSISTKVINAANLPIKKSVFCVDNVNPICSEDDIAHFVTNLHVTVVSCFEVKPRWRYSDNGNDPIHRKAFRLCIHSEDCDKLLDASKWPARVAIYEYFFKKKNPTNSNANDHEPWRDKLKDVPRDTLSHPSRTFGSAMQSLQVETQVPALLPLDTGNSGLRSGDVDVDHGEKENDMDATILTPYSPGMNASAFNMVLTQSPSHGSI